MIYSKDNIFDDFFKFSIRKLKDNYKNRNAYYKKYFSTVKFVHSGPFIHIEIKSVTDH